MRLPIVVLDANVLYPAPVRDLLLHCATLGLYQPIWSDLIQDEWIRNLARNRQELSIQRLRRTEALMNQYVLLAAIVFFLMRLSDFIF